MTSISESRANELWARLAGMFGPERLARTFGKTPPLEWVELCGRLKDYELQRGIRRVMASGTDQIPPAPKFRKFCQETRNDDIDEPQSQPLPQLPSNLAAQDEWDMASNRHLLGYLAKRLKKDPRAYGPIVHWTTSNRQGSPQQQHCTAILVHWKKHWAQMMREEAVDGQVDGGYQHEQWDAYMRQAEEEIAANVLEKAA